MLTVAQIAPLKDRDPYLYETLTKIVAAVNATSQSAGVDSSTPSPAPSPIASVTVQASNGWFDISITDPSASRPGLFYFAEQVARESGCDAPFLSVLCDPAQGLAIGCKVLRRKFDAVAGDTTRALLAWNGGANPAYPVQVLARRAHYL